MIEVKGLVKRYDENLAVDDITFTVEKGKIYGFLGPNGAGKTTTMNIITGCLGATAGEVLINGHDIFEEPIEAKKNIGYLPEQPPVYLDMTPAEYLEFVGELKGLNKAQRSEQIAKVMDETQIADVKNRLIKHLSKGYRQRVGLAQALLGEPEVLVLDEPTVGLDPKQIIEIRDLIKSLGKQHTIILSSHILSEVSAICDYILIISKGKLVAADTPEGLSSWIKGSSSLSVTVKGTEEKISEALKGIPEILSMKLEPAQEEQAFLLTLETDEHVDIREKVSLALPGAGCPILGMTRTTMSLEEIFLALTGDEKTEKKDGENGGRDEEEDGGDDSGEEGEDEEEEDA